MEEVELEEMPLRKDTRQYKKSNRSGSSIIHFTCPMFVNTSNARHSAQQSVSLFDDADSEASVQKCQRNEKGEERLDVTCFVFLFLFRYEIAVYIVLVLKI